MVAPHVEIDMRILLALLLVSLGACAVAVVPPTGGGDPVTAGGTLASDPPDTREADGTTGVTGATGPFGTLLNQARAQAGLGAVSPDARLERAAATHAADMAARGAMSHRGSNGSTVAQRVRGAGYSFALVAENIGEGFGSEQAVFQAWQGSSGHRANQLNPRITEYGLARSGAYWVLVLATPR